MGEVEGKVTDVIIGVDLGKMNDFTAMAGVERLQKYKAWPHEGEEYGESYYRLRFLERFPLNTDWVEQAYFAKAIYDSVKEFWAEKNITPDIIIDGTGVGAPMIDVFKRLIPWAKGCYFTSGYQVNLENGIYYVPKEHLVTNEQIIMQSRRIKFARNIPDQESLRTELLNFSYKINEETGYVSFEHGKNSQKDDQVIAIALALWFGERGTRRLLPFDRRKLGI